MSDAVPTFDVLLDADAWQQAQVDETRVGLSRSPRTFSPVWFYDEVGSQLFDQITEQPEYYQTRAERALLVRHGAEIADLGAETLVELGSGTSDKTTALLDAMEAVGSLRSYVPFDVSEEMLRSAASELQPRYPNISVHGIVGDFNHHLGAVPRTGRHLVAFLGGTIGNFRPADRARFLFDLDCALDHEDLVLIGIDLVKDPDRIVAAYDDAAGVTAAFNRNALSAMNVALDANFDPDAYQHISRWNEHDQWIEMRLRARSDQQVEIPGLDLAFDLSEGDELLTEISAKFTVEGFTSELYDRGLIVQQTWTAPDDDFALVLASPYC